MKHQEVLRALGGFCRPPARRGLKHLEHLPERRSKAATPREGVGGWVENVVGQVWGPVRRGLLPAWGVG